MKTNLTWKAWLSEGGELWQKSLQKASLQKIFLIALIIGSMGLGIAELFYKEILWFTPGYINLSQGWAIGTALTIITMLVINLSRPQSHDTYEWLKKVIIGGGGMAAGLIAGRYIIFALVVVIIISAIIVGLWQTRKLFTKKEKL